MSAPAKPRQKPPVPRSAPVDDGPATWTDAVLDLYLSTVDMDGDELDRLMSDAVRGHRPDDARLPAYLPLPSERGL